VLPNVLPLDETAEDAVLPPSHKIDEELKQESASLPCVLTEGDDDPVDSMENRLDIGSALRSILLGL
jgi:hypothetical protein